MGGLQRRAPRRVLIRALARPLWSNVWMPVKVLARFIALGVLWSAAWLAQGQTPVPDWAEAPRPEYKLAPKDHILIRTPQARKLDGRIFKVESDGFVTLPSIGRIQAAGLMLASFQDYIAGRLRKWSSRDPEVHILLVNFKEHRNGLTAN